MCGEFESSKLWNAYVYTFCVQWGIRVQEIERAIAFVKANGNEIEQVRLQVLLGEKVDTARAIESIAQTQSSDGGWAPFWADSSALDSTCFRLAQLEQLGATGTADVVRRALQFIIRKQRIDGSWEEDDRLADVAPPWCKPGDLSARLYLTSNCAYWLTFFKTAPKNVGRATAFLLEHVNSDGKLPSFLHTQWLTAGVLYSTQQVSQAAKILSYLHRRMDELDASNLSWMINSLRAVGVPSSHQLIQQARTLLLASQEPDGSWRSENGPDQDVHTTLESIRAIITH
jgi:hypothetical protein